MLDQNITSPSNLSWFSPIWIVPKRTCPNPNLQYPDFEISLILTTNARNFAIGAILSQRIVGLDNPISQTLNDSERIHFMGNQEPHELPIGTKI